MIGSWLGLDSGALHVLASLVVLLAAAKVTRRPVSSWSPWCAVLVLELANEAATAWADRLLEEWELSGSMQDVALVMIAPTLLLVAARSSPRLFGIEPKLLVPSWSAGRKKAEIIDVQFEEIPVSEASSKPA